MLAWLTATAHSPHGALACSTDLETVPRPTNCVYPRRTMRTTSCSSRTHTRSRQRSAEAPADRETATTAVAKVPARAWQLGRAPWVPQSPTSWWQWHRQEREEAGQHIQRREHGGGILPFDVVELAGVGVLVRVPVLCVVRWHNTRYAIHLQL